MAAVKVHIRDPYIDRGHEATCCGLPLRWPGGRAIRRYMLTERGAQGEPCRKCIALAARRGIGRKLLNT